MGDTPDQMEAALAVGEQTVASPAGVGPSRSFRVSVAVLLLAAGGYVLCQRIGTRANVEVVEYSENLAGGFLAIGMTDDQPGLLVLSALDQVDTELVATQRKNAVTGNATSVALTTAADAREWRLRGPLVITIDEDAAVDSAPLPWSYADFQAARKATDCSRPGKGKPLRCGEPFEDLADFCRELAAEKQPQILRQFLSRRLSLHKSLAG